MWKKKYILKTLSKRLNSLWTKIDFIFRLSKAFLFRPKYGIVTHGTPLALNNKVVRKLKSELGWV